jgi:molecular chaperone Hsp33
MKDQDQSRRFLFEQSPIRGRHVSLDTSWQKILSQSEAEGYASILLGQALTAVTLLVDTLKIDGSVILQIRGTGPIHLLVAEATSDNTIRGIVRQSQDLNGETSMQKIFGTDKLIITIKNGIGEPHQGIVLLTGDNLASALQAYFEQSEQLPTRFWLASNQQTATGLMLQKLPEQALDSDSWNRVLHLAATTTEQELLDLRLESLLHRLFHEDDLRLFESCKINFACSCSPQRTRDMLISLGKDEVEDIMKKQKEVTITCEFCNAQYRFDKVDLRQLVLNQDYVSPSPTKH